MIPLIFWIGLGIYSLSTLILGAIYGHRDIEPSPIAMLVLILPLVNTIAVTIYFSGELIKFVHDLMGKQSMNLAEQERRNRLVQEDKELLLKDLYARLRYRINVLTKDNDEGYIVGVDDTENGVFVIHIIEDGDSYTCDESIENFKPYLRPMSSMTSEESSIWMRLEYLEGIDWLNEHHFDYRGLIKKGLALEAPEDMYKN